MENKSNTTLSPCRSENILKKYYQLTSPLVSMQSVKRQELMKDELRQNVSMKLDCIKNRNSKVYALDTSQSFTELKAAATLYQIPQFSVPEVNFEVSEQIRKKVDEAKREIISYFPEISRSSNYAPKKIEHQLNHRTAVRELEDWLKEKLRSPPTSAQESIQYKNMIMGVGMKELIRIIGKRCSQEGRMAEEIWELTWSICREIILYLSKRAKKCQQLLEEELLFMRASYQKQYQRLNAQNMELTTKVQSLEEENKQFLSQLVKLRKRRQGLEDENKSLTFDNFHIQQEFKKVLEENLAIYLQIGDKNKRGWIKKMYKNINALPEEVEKTVKDVFKKEIVEVVQDRIKLEEVTGDCEDNINSQEIEAIGNGQLEKASKKKNRRSKKNNKKISKISKVERNDQNTLITALNDPVISNEKSEYEAESSESEASCAEMIDHMREQFLPIDAEIQTDQKQLIDAYASTYTPQLMERMVGVDSSMLGYLQEIGINTEQIKEEPKTFKKKGKQNTKEEGRKEKSKIYNVPPMREKSKPKVDKEKKSILDIVQETNIQHQQSRVSQRQESVSLVNQQPTLQNMPGPAESKAELINNLVETRSFYKKNSFFTSSQALQPSFKTNSAIYSPTFALEIRQKATAHLLQPTKKDDLLIKKLEENIAPIQISLQKSFERDSTISYIADEKQMHSISFDTGVNRLRDIEERCSKMATVSECNIYICAQCNKILTSYDEKFQNPKYRINRLQKGAMNSQEKKSQKCSPSGSIKRLTQDQNDDNQMGQKRSSGMRRVRRENRKNSSYIHDIAFKKDLEEQQQQQQQLQQQSPFKSTFYNSRDQTYQNGQQAQEISEVHLNANNKVAPYFHFFSQLIEGNKSLVQNIVNAPQQIAENLQHYFEMVREINGLPENKISISEKSTISIIEKNIFPIINQLLGSVKKAVKTNKVAQMMKVFTSLPNIIYNRITRKYGVKILAIKNLKILLMALKEAGKYTDKYKIIELMMFTDCKSPHSEDLFMYLFVMALFDPTFSSSRLINLQEVQTVRKLCEDYLTKQPLIYHEFDKITIGKENESVLLSNLVKSIVTNYRLLKINRIEEVGFVYLMLKKDHHMSYKKFIYFLAALNLPHSKKTKIAKKMLEFCDIKNKDQKIGISEIMFSKFLMNCEDFSYKLLEETVNSQLQTYKSSDKDIVTHLSNQFFKTQKFIQTKYEVDQTIDPRNKPLQQAQFPRDSIAIHEKDASILSSELNNSLEKEQGQKTIENITVVRQIKEYSSFTYQVCKYLESIEETKFLTYRQHLFIKNYLIVHIIESEIQKTVGLVDYFSNSMLEMLKMPLEEFSIAYDRKS